MTKAAKTPKPHGPQGPEYTHKITCAKRGCKEVRWCKPQDAFQVRYCAEHQAEAAKERRSAQAKAKREAAAKTKPAAKPKTPAKPKVKTPAKTRKLKAVPATPVERAIAAVDAAEALAA
jgi:hypothetical protein